MGKKQNEPGVFVSQRNLKRCDGNWGLAALLSQIEYWSLKKNPGDWIEQQYREWEEQLVTSERTLRSWFKKLESAGFIERRVGKSRYYRGQQTLCVRLKAQSSVSEPAEIADDTASEDAETAAPNGRNVQDPAAEVAGLNGSNGRFSSTETHQKTKKTSFAEAARVGGAATDNSLSNFGEERNGLSEGSEVTGNAVNGRNEPSEEVRRTRKDIADAIHRVFGAAGQELGPSQVNGVAKKLQERGYCAGQVAPIYEYLKGKKFEKGFGPNALVKYAGEAMDRAFHDPLYSGYFEQAPVEGGSPWRRPHREQYPSEPPAGLIVPAKSQGRDTFSGPSPTDFDFADIPGFIHVENPDEGDVAPW